LFDVALSAIWASTGDILLTSRAARHSSPAVTAGVYAHMRSGKLRSAFETISTALETTPQPAA